MKFGNITIGGMSFGSTKIGGAKYGGTLVFQSGGGPTPPPTPTNIPYVRGGGDGSYIDTGITPDNTTKIIIWARNWNPGFTAYNWLCGARVGDHNNSFILGLPSSANTGRVAVCYGNIDTVLTEDWSLLTHYHKYELSGDGFYVDDTLVSSVTAATFSTNYNIHLFGYNNGGTHSDACVLPRDICACKIYKNGTLVRDFTAVDTPSVGFYDAVSQTVFTNAGSGSFTHGTFASDAYSPLEYISCDGNQYFDSGIKGTGSMVVVTKFRPTNTTPLYHSMFGERVSSPADSFDISFGTNSASSDNIRMYWRIGATTNAQYVFNGSTSNKLTGLDLVGAKNNGTFTIYENGTQKGTASMAVSSSFETAYTLAVGTLKSGASTYLNEPYHGRLYYLGLGASGAFVPASVSGVVGMYNLYNDQFYPSVSGTDFIAGPSI